MTKPWDESMRWLVRTSPQAFVDWIVPGAQFTRVCPEKLREAEIEVGSLLEVQLEGGPMLLHLEFQTDNDAAVAERLLYHNVFVRSEYELPVLSCVIYLFKQEAIQQSPLTWSVPLGRDVLRFHFKSIEVAAFAPEDILRTRQIGLLPLLPLTKGGATRDVVLRMFEELQPAENRELALIGFTLASLVFKREKKDELDWLIRSFPDMHDILRETPIYQEILKEGREEGCK